MNIQSKGTVMVLAKNVREGSNRQLYYNLAILTDGQAGNISCTEEAYDKAVINAQNEAVFAFNDQYKSFRVMDIIPAPYVPEASDNGTDNSTGTKPDDKADGKTDKPGNKPDTKAAR